MFDRGYRGGISCVGRSVSSGSWRNYLNELDAAHILIELLRSTLTPEEQRVLDAVDDYGRRAPTGFTSNCLPSSCRSTTVVGGSEEQVAVR